MQSLIQRVGVAAVFVATVCGHSLAEHRPPRWIDSNDAVEPNSYVTAMVEWDPDGPGPLGTELVVGTLDRSWSGASLADAFSTTGPGAWIHRFNGVAWAPLGPDSQSGWNQPANKLLAIDTRLYVACTDSVRFWNGAHWQLLGTTDAPVLALASYQGSLYAAGSFTQIGGAPAARIARWDGLAWHDLGGGASATTVHDLAVFQDKLIVAGEYRSVGTQRPREPFLATWDGTAWGDFGGSVANGAPTRVTKLAVANDTLYFCGSFTSVAGMPQENCAARDGHGWKVLPPLSAVPTSLNVGETGVYVSGAFSIDDPSTHWNALLHLDADQWRPAILRSSRPVWGNGIGGICHFRGTPIITNGRLAYGYVLNGAIRGVLGDNAICPMGPYVGEAPIALEHQGVALVGGPDSRFWTPSGPARSLAAWDGAAFHPFAPEMNIRVATAAIHWNGGLVLAGDFLPGNAANARRCAFLDGQGWTALDSGLGIYHPGSADYAVTALGIHEGDLYAAVSQLLDSPPLAGTIGPAIWRLHAGAWAPADEPRTFDWIRTDNQPFRDFDFIYAQEKVRCFGSCNGELFAGGSAFAVDRGTPPFDVAWSALSPVRLTTGGWVRTAPRRGTMSFSYLSDRNYGLYDFEIVNGELLAAGGMTNLLDFAGIMKWTPAGWDRVGPTSNSDPIVGLKYLTSSTMTNVRSISEWHGLPFAVGLFNSTYNGVWNDPTILGRPTSATMWDGKHWVSLTARGPFGMLAEGVSRQVGLGYSDAKRIIPYNGRLLILGDHVTAGGYNSPSIAQWDPGDAILPVETPPPTVTACSASGVTLGITTDTPESVQWRSYQWLRDGVPIADGPAPEGTYSGATTAHLVIQSPHAGARGEYACRVTSHGGVATSRASAVYVAPDINQPPDGVVNTADLVVLLLHFGDAATPGSPAAGADFNLDGVVNTADLVYMLHRFGSACP